MVLDIHQSVRHSMVNQVGIIELFRVMKDYENGLLGMKTDR